MLDVARAAGVALGNGLQPPQRLRPRLARRPPRRSTRPSPALATASTWGRAASASQRTQSVGLVLPNISNPFYAEMARAVEHALWEQGFQTLLCDSSQNAERERKHLDNLREPARRRHPDHPLGSAARASSSSGMSVPVVCLDRVDRRPAVRHHRQPAGRAAGGPPPGGPGPPADRRPGRRSRPTTTSGSGCGLHGGAERAAGHRAAADAHRTRAGHRARLRRRPPARGRRRPAHRHLLHQRHRGRGRLAEPAGARHPHPAGHVAHRLRRHRDDPAADPADDDRRAGQVGSWPATPPTC